MQTTSRAAAPSRGSSATRVVCGRRVSAARHTPLTVRRTPAPAAEPGTSRAAAATAAAPRVSARRGPAPAAAAAPGGAPAGLDEEPETAREAIELGNRLAKEGRWPDALAVYEQALTLPGTGVKRFRDKPRLISDGERSAALFNIACCHAQLGDTRAGLVALAGCLEAGYDEFAVLRADPDLAPLRSDARFEALMARFQRPAGGGGLGGLLGSLFGGRK